APHHLEHDGSAGIRLLRQRQSGCGSSALEPGARAAGGGAAPSSHPDVQRVWRPGGEPLWRDGSAEELLKEAVATRLVRSRSTRLPLGRIAGVASAFPFLLLVFDVF